MTVVVSFRQRDLCVYGEVLECDESLSNSVYLYRSSSSESSDSSRASYKNINNMK
jgi:hypothetical protein